MIKSPEEGETGIRDPIIALDVTKINMLKKLITRDRQPWMRWIERKLTRITIRWKVDEAMAAKTVKKQRKKLKD